MNILPHNLSYMYDLLQLDFGRGEGKKEEGEEEIVDEKEKKKRAGFVKRVKGAGARWMPW